MITRRSKFLLFTGMLAHLTGCATTGDVEELRGELRRLDGELRRARQEAVQAQMQVRQLDLRTEVHSYLQRDPLLAASGHFPSLEQRIFRASRAVTLVLRSEPGPEGARALYFRPHTTLRIDFVSGVLATDDAADRLEVSSRWHSFRPLGQPENETHTYTIQEGEVLLLETLEPSYPPPQQAEQSSAASEISFRFLPARGPAPMHQAYVRITLIEAAPEQEDQPVKLPRVRRPRQPMPTPPPEEEALEMSFTPDEVSPPEDTAESAGTVPRPSTELVPRPRTELPSPVMDEPGVGLKDLLREPDDR